MKGKSEEGYVTVSCDLARPGGGWLPALAVVAVGLLLLLLGQPCPDPACSVFWHSSEGTGSLYLMAL